MFLTRSRRHPYPKRNDTDGWGDGRYNSTGAVQQSETRLPAWVDGENGPVPRRCSTSATARRSGLLGKRSARLQHHVNLPAFAVAFALRFEHHRCLAIQEVKGSLVPVEHSD